MNTRRTLLLSLWMLSSAVAALPYDETADAQASVKNALAAAKAEGLTVLVIFGANWCEDCRALDLALSNERNAKQMAREFKVVKVDVGNFNRNLDLARAYGNPIKKGIPAAVLLSPQNEVLYATQAGELADARRMSESGVHDFFEGVVRNARRK